MSLTLSQNGNYFARKNDIIFVEGQAIHSINILLQGKIDVYISPTGKTEHTSEENVINNSYRIFSLGGNIFISPNDLFASKKYSFSYRTSDDCSIYAYNVHNQEQLKALFNTQKDYAAYVVNSITVLMNNSLSALNKLNNFVKTINTLNDNLITFYWHIKESYGFPCTPSGKFFRKGWDYFEKLREKNVSMPAEFYPDFFETDRSDLYDTSYSFSTEASSIKIDYYRHFAEMPADLRKSFLSTNNFITDYHCEESSTLLSGIQSDLRDSIITAEHLIKNLYSNGNDCILNEYTRAAFEMKKMNSDISLISKVIDYICVKIKEIALIYEGEYNHSLDIDINNLEDIQREIKELGDSLFEIKPECYKDLVEISEGLGSIPVELENSAEKIIDYSGIPSNRAEAFLESLETFLKMKDRLSADGGAREIRKAISAEFFGIYEAVFKRVIAERNNSRLYHMFLNFGYMDENLLSPHHIINLYKIVDNQSSSGLCPVYTMRDWLVKIRNMEKDPSINEFGQDYFDTFRELKKRRDFSEKEKAEYENNIDARLNYEISNMLKTNQKLCHGQMNVYVPVLHNEMITRDISKALLTPDKINESVRKILDIDYSAFHREISYRNPETGVEKELIMKAVMPDIILVPIFGSRVFMWQELSGRVRSSPGRFILPVFTDEDPGDLLIKLIGNFRWELCRTMMGVSWNDITQKSLTSEYMDYIQFFKKNRDLSDEAKEKIKSQIQKYHNVARDIFTADYETWINYESKGIIRLNKVVRNILYKHCPFPREIRSNLEKQPLFADIAMQFKNVRSKYVRELENRYTKLVKNGNALDPELEQNLKFYKEM